MKKHLLTILTACITAGLTTSSRAEVTAPVGYVKLTFNANADTPFSLPMNRAKAYAGQVSSLSGNVITIAATDLTDSQFVYADGTQNEKYYVLFTTGALEGRTFDITANSTTSITVDQDGDQSVEALINDASATDLFEIRPHWTLDTLFPDGANFPASSNNNTPNGLIIYRTQSELDASDIGVNIAPSEGYFYFDNGNAALEGWYPQGSTTKSPDDILRKNIMYVYRNNTPTTHTVDLVGDVPLVDAFAEVKILSDFINQDNYMTYTFPIDMSLTELGFLNMANFNKSTGNSNTPNGDIIQIYPAVSPGFNPAPVAQYIYFDPSGTANDGWYLVGDVEPGRTVDNDKIFKPGTGYVIRKAQAVEVTDGLNTPIQYNPFAE